MKRWAVLPGVGLIAAAALSGPPPAVPQGPVVLKTTEFGRGSTVVLLHGLASGRMVWMPTARKLLPGHRVVMADLPGHGESPLPEPFSIEACAAALDQLLARHKPDSTVVVACGVAALIALQQVQTHPDRVRGLVVIDAATRLPMKIPEQQQQRFFASLETRYDEILRGMMRSQARDSAQGAELYAQAQSVPPASVKAYLRAAMNLDVSSAFKKMKPAFLFVGSGRLWPEGKDWATLARELGYDDPASIAARRVPDCGPLIMKEQPDSLAAVIAEFTARALAAR